MPEIGKTYKIEGRDESLTGKVFDIKEGDYGLDVYVTCASTGDEYGICTRDAVFTKVKPK